METTCLSCFCLVWVYNLWDVPPVSTEQYVGEYENKKSLDEVEITKVDNLKILDVKFNKELEERYPELGDKRGCTWVKSRTCTNVISFIGRFNLVEGDRDVQLSIINDLKVNEIKIEKTKYTHVCNYL